MLQVAIGGAGRVRWTPASNGNVPPGAPVAGLTKDGQPLYACRFHSERRLSMACGAVSILACFTWSTSLLSSVANLAGPHRCSGSRSGALPRWTATC